MKYEEIEVGESYETESRYAEKVIFKHDETRQVVTIDKYSDIYSFNEDELKSFQPIKKELPEIGLLAFGSNTIVYRTGRNSGFGFNLFGRYLNNDLWYFGCSPEHWRIATPEEYAKFIKLLEAEAEKRGLGVDAKIKCNADNGATYRMNDGKWRPLFDLDFANNKHGRIFSNGTWAEPLTMLDEVTEVIKKHLPNIVIEMTDGVVTLKRL